MIIELQVTPPRPESGLDVSDIQQSIRILLEAVERKPELIEVLGFMLEDIPPEYYPEELSAPQLQNPKTWELAVRVSRSDKQAAANVIEDLFNERAQIINAQLVDGSITVDDWYERIRQEISHGHVQTYAAGRGGNWEDISFREWGRLGQRIRRQNQFLQAFANDLKGQETISLKYINNRVGLYGSNFRESLEAGIAQDRGLDPSVFPAIPGDGSTLCLVRCKCRWTIRPAGKDRFFISWRLGRAEHCRTCLDRARDWVNLEVYKGNLITTPAPHFR